MTLAYNTFFATIWLANILSIPASIALFIWAVTQHSDTARLVLGIALSLAFLTWVIYLRLHGPRVLMRAGAWPAFGRGDFFPTTELQLTVAVADVVRRTGRPPRIVGSGWGFFLQRSGPPGPRIFMHAFKGLQPDKSGKRFRSGSTIFAVQKHFLSQKPSVCFKTHPTMDYISIGSWFSAGNHGNGGSPAGRSSDALKDARVLDMTTGLIDIVEYSEIRSRFDGSDSYKYCLLDCEFHNLVVDSDVQKRCIVVDSPEAAAAWLDPTQELRLLFLGAARDVGLGIQWGPLYGTDYHPGRDPHFGSRLCQFLQVDVCSAIGGWYESDSYEVDGVKYLKQFTGVTRRSQANRWVPTVWPIQTIAVVVGGIRNFEVFFRLNAALDGTTLWRFVQSMIAIHKAHGGRSEIRHGAVNSVVCLDVSLSSNFNAPFKLLKQEFGVKQVALHIGKFSALSTAPCKRVPLGVL